jgi:two-component system sensor histidine kinase ChiS
LYLCLTAGKDRGSLYSSTQFFSLAVLLLFTGQKLIYGWLPNMPFELFCKIQLLSLIGVLASTVAYTNFTEKWVISDFLKRMVLVVFSVYAFLLIVMNYETSSYLNGFIYAFICTIYLYILIKLCMAYHMVTPDTILEKEILLYLSCTACLFIAFLNNFLYNLTWIPTRAFGMIGLCGFILLSQIFIAFRFAVNYENMVKMDKMKDEFIIKTSYELKAPLNSIFNISEHMIKEHSKGDFSMESCVENAALTKNIVQRLLNIVNTSLDIILLNNDQLKPIISSVDMKVCIDLAMESVRDFMPNKNIEIRSELTKSFFVEADEGRVRQILWNLILNSVKSMGQGTIWIRGKREQGMVCVSVEDNGCGIPEDKWEEIFQPYTTLKSQGIGLGLYVTRQLVELMQGNLCVEWSELNRGTRFVLRLPGSAVKDEVDYENAGKKIDLSGKQKRKFSENRSRNHNQDTAQDVRSTVLVVDDEIFNLKTAAYILGGEGYRVLTAQSGEEALHIVQTQPVDLIILDVMLPRDSGISVCKKIRETFSLIELPVLIAVVGTENHDINLGLEAGANDFILKPFQEAEVKARTKTLIELKKSIEETMMSEMAFLQAQIKPHFLYNAINTMVSFCYTDSEKAAKLLSDFSKYLRLTFDVDHTHMLIPLSREIELIDAYTAIEQARIGDEIKLQYDIDPELMDMEIPPLCIQPLVENAIKHGLCRKKGGGTVFLSVRKNEAELRIEVRDTGAGMTEEKLNALRGTEERTGGGRVLQYQQENVEVEASAD